MLFITACGTATTEEEADPGNGANEAVEEENTAEEDNPVEQEEEPVAEEDEGAAEPGADVIREEAVYVGMADPHTIEVETESETIALQILDPGVADIDFEAIEPNTNCTIEYYKNEHGQNILTDFEIKE